MLGNLQSHDYDFGNKNRSILVIFVAADRADSTVNVLYGSMDRCSKDSAPIVFNLKRQERTRFAQRAAGSRNGTAAGIKFVIAPVIGRAASIYAREATEVNEFMNN